MDPWNVSAEAGGRLEVLIGRDGLMQQRRRKRGRHRPNGPGTGNRALGGMSGRTAQPLRISEPNPRSGTNSAQALCHKRMTTGYRSAMLAYRPRRGGGHGGAQVSGAAVTHKTSGSERTEGRDEKPRDPAQAGRAVGARAQAHEVSWLDLSARPGGGYTDVTAIRGLRGDDIVTGLRDGHECPSFDRGVVSMSLIHSPARRRRLSRAVLPAIIAAVTAMILLVTASPAVACDDCSMSQTSHGRTCNG